MADEIKLDVELRSDLSGSYLSQLRNNGKIPAVVYGPDLGSTPVVFNEKEFRNVVSTEHGENVLIKVKLGKKRPVTTIIKEIQVHPITNKIIHVDLCQINLTEKIEVEVPVEVEGEAYGVKTEGGVLEHIIRAVKIKCLPTDIPDNFILNVTELKIGDALKISDLPRVKDVDILEDQDSLVINIVAPTELKESEEEALPEEAEPEVIGKKPEGEGKEGQIPESDQSEKE
ncbi:50S ribosomal protein L25 [Elusimicrobiota bacterium]